MSEPASAPSSAPAKPENGAKKTRRGHRSRKPASKKPDNAKETDAAKQQPGGENTPQNGTNTSESTANADSGASNQPQESKKAAKAKSRHRFQKKKTQRRTELDELNEKYKSFQIEPDLFQVLMNPSDPDFPYDILVLDLDLHVSRHHPNQGNAYININNQEIPKGNAINIENAFNRYQGTLVEKLKQVDLNLEKLIAMPPARTFTIVKPKPKTAADSARDVKKPASVVESKKEDSKEDSAGQKPESSATPAAPTPSTKEQKSPESNEKSASQEKLNNQVADFSLDDVASGSGSSSDSDSDSGSDDDYNPGYAHSSDDEDIDLGAPKQDMSKPRREGTELVFTNIVLTNISLCEIVSLNLLMQCGRCKTMHTFNNLQSAEYGKDSKPRAELCSKCDLPLMMAFRKEYLHSMCHTAGYLDVEGGRAADLLPSSYAAMCAQCQQWSPVFKNVDLGAHRMMACRNCHTKMWITLELFDFVMLSSSTLSAGAKQAQRSKLPDSAPKQKLKLTGGVPLERYGTCEHYRKSTRWFRFTCCQRVFPCDKCHDLEMQHPCEPASRMICGYCSREQKFTMKCVYCEHDYTQRVTKFWEGGSGVRDRKLMSRKDKRKYRRDPAEKQKKEGPHFRGKSKAAPK